MSGYQEATGEDAFLRNQHFLTICLYSVSFSRSQLNNRIIITKICDPSTEQWNATASMGIGLECHTTTLVHSGEVLITAGEELGSHLTQVHAFGIDQDEK